MRRDVIVAALGTQMLDEVIALLGGTGSKKPLAADPRFKQEVAKLEARRTEILGQANASVEKMKNEAEAEGYEMLVNAFGTGQAYNLYTFAENFKPESIHLFFAGEGTFWTDLSRFQELGAARLLEAKSELSQPD